MATIRIMQPSDVAAVANLHRRVSPAHGFATPQECERYFRSVLFENPWSDLDIPSWIAEDGDNLAGFYAVVPRPMRIGARRLRVAVGCQVTVAPEYRGLTAFQLVRACLSGSQDLTLADGAHDKSRRMWLGIGGAAPPLYNLHWIKPLRPARCLLAILERRSALARFLGPAARPLSTLIDTLSPLLRPRPPEEDGADPPLQAETMLQNWSDVVDDKDLQPIYDDTSLPWVLDQAKRNRARGCLRAQAVYEGSRLLGWYLYFVRVGGPSEVVQVLARKGAFETVFRRLVADAWHHHCAALRGRMDPRHLEELAAQQCWFRRDGRSTLIYSRDAEVVRAIYDGQAVLSRLEGEWYLRFASDTPSETSSMRKFTEGAPASRH